MNKEEALSSKTRIRILKELAKGRRTANLGKDSYKKVDNAVIIDE